MFRVRTLTLAGIVWAATMDLTACTSSQSAEDPRTVPQLAEVAVVQPAEVGERAFTGLVSARVQSNLGFRVSGKVIERLVDSGQDRKSTRLNSSHLGISYAVFCLKKKNK